VDVDLLRQADAVQADQALQQLLGGVRIRGMPCRSAI
jgi:hypothetical protein